MTTLRFPDPTTTTRPDIPVADAYLIDGMESEVVDADYFVLPFASDVDADETVIPLTLLCSVDHGLRTADETSAIIGINIAAEVLAPFIRMTGGDPTTLDWWGAMCSVLEVDGWTDGWLPDEYQDADVHAWSHDMESAAHAAGLIAETSGDSGMSWLYAPMCDPIGKPRPTVPDAMGYAPFAVMDDGGVLCESCVRDESNPVHSGGDADGWRVDGWSHSGETDEAESCDHCGAVIVEGHDQDDDDEAVNRAAWWIQDNIGGRARGDVADIARRVLAGIEDGDPMILDALDGADEVTVAAACRDLLTDDQH